MGGWYDHFTITTLFFMKLKKADLKKAKEIKTFLEENYQENHDYNSLSNRFGLNFFKLKYAFKTVTNYNIHAFLIKLKIERAKELLENTDETIDHIAAQVGLNRSNLFIQFKKLTGQTPSQWRNTNNLTQGTGHFLHHKKT